MILDVDIGNSRIKWRLSRAHGCVAIGSASHSGEAWALSIAPGAHDVQRVRVSNVAGSKMGDAFAGWVIARFGIGAEFAVATRSAAGVTCGYVVPGTLGVDRWLAVLATWHKVGAPSVIVDAGSAITVDVLAEEGIHTGGYIVPGLQMMQRALYVGTNLVKVEAPAVAELVLGTSTREAVLHGCLAMAVALIQAVRNNSQQARLMMTGGDAEIIAKFMGGDVVVEPDLVLDGLALALP